MSDSIKHVSLVTWTSTENFFKRKSNDFEREPLFSIGCFCLIAGKIQELSGFVWNHVVDFGKIGNKISGLVDYWELVDLCQEVYKGFKILSLEESRREVFKTAKKVAFTAFGVFSCFVNFIGAMEETSSIRGINIYKWKFFGSILGIAYWGDKLHENFYKGRTEPENIEKIKDISKDIYQRQYARQAFFENLVKVATISLKIIELCTALSSLYRVPNIIKFISSYKSNLFLGGAIGLTVGFIGSHLYGEQMRAFEESNRI